MKTKVELISEIQGELDELELRYDEHIQECTRCLDREDCNQVENILYEIGACEDEIAELA